MATPSSLEHLHMIKNSYGDDTYRIGIGSHYPNITITVNMKALILLMSTVASQYNMDQIQQRDRDHGS